MLSVPVEVGVAVALAELEERDVDDDELDLSLLFCCANTPFDSREEAKRADRSKERFSDSGGDSMVAVIVSLRIRGQLKKGFGNEDREKGIGP